MSLSRVRDALGLNDRARIKTVLLILGIIIAASMIVWTTARFIGVNEDGSLAHFFGRLSTSPWALLAVIGVFSLASFVGAPQFMLIAVTVAAFGPVKGFVFAYLATLFSASANFFVARAAGAKWLRSRELGTITGISQLVGRNGFMIAMLVRIIPSAPFVIVNGALGLSKTSYLAFIAGTAIGILPKTAVIALLGKVVERRGLR